MTRLICVGLNHKTAPVEIREQVAIPQNQQAQLLLQVHTGQLEEIEELAVLSTCNRTEFYAFATGDNAIQTLEQLLVKHGDLKTLDWRSMIYSMTDQACVEHLFRVAAGLDSQVVGEPQILGQVVDAYEQAQTNQSIGSILSTLMQQAIHTGKRVRSETLLGEGALSIGSVAAMHSRHILGDLDKACVLLIGAGEMARTAVSAFVRRGVDRLVITNRTLEHAQELAAEWAGQAVPFTQLSDALIEADLVIAAAYAPHTILYAPDVEVALPHRNNRPLVIFDIAMPRNVAVEVGALPNVQLYNLDDLQSVSEAHYQRRQSAVPHAESIVMEAVQAFADWRSTRVVVPTIQRLRAKIEAIRQSEVDLLLRRLPELSEQERQVITEFSQRLINKVLHEPTLQLKKHSTDAEMYTSIVSNLFNLEVHEQ